MAQRVEGLIYEYSVDDSEIRTSLTQVNKLTKKTSKTAIALEKSLSTAFDPTDIEAVQSVLADNERLMKDLKKETNALANELKSIDKEASDFNPEQYEKLEFALLEADTQLKKLEKDQKRYNQTIEAIDTGDLDKLPKKYKASADGLDDVSDSVKGIDFGELSGQVGQLGGEVAGTLTNFGGMSAIIGELPALINPATAGFVALGGAIKVVGTYTENTRTAQFNLANVTNDTSVNMNKQVGVARDLSRTLNIDMEEASATAREAMVAYGDSISSTSDMMEDSLKVFALNQQGIIDSSDAYSVATASARNFGLDTEQNEQLVGKLTTTVENFGRQGEDVIDTYIEWGDTFASTGQDADEMLTILNTGLLLGARSTDEVANAWNELTLRIGDGTAQESIESLGLSWDDTVQKFNKGGRDTQEVVLDLLNGLSDMEDTTKRTATAFNIFGTYGEEFIATTVDNKETMKELNAEFERTTKIQNNLSEVTGKNSETWKTMQSTLQLTDGELQEVKTRYEELGLAGLTTNEQTVILDDALKNLGETNNLTATQIGNMQLAMDIMRGTLPLTTENVKTATNGFKLLGDQGIISKTAVDDLTFATQLMSGQMTLSKEQVDTMTDSINILSEREDWSAGRTQALRDTVAILGNESLTGKDKLSELEGVILNLGLSGEITYKQQNNLIDSITALKDESTPTSEKMTILKNGIEKVGKASGLTDAQVEEYTNKLDGASNAARNGTTDQEGLANQMADTKSDTNNATDALDRLTLAFIESQSPLDKHRIKSKLGADAMADLESSAKGAGSEVDGATGDIKDYNSTNLEDKDAKVDVDTSEMDEAESKWNFLSFGKKTAQAEVNVTEKRTSAKNANSVSALLQSSQRGIATQQSVQNLNVSVNYASSNARTQNDVKFLATEVSREIAKKLR